MTPYSCKSREELEQEHEALLKAFEAQKQLGLHLNMARGKPSSEQLDLVSGILTAVTTPEECMDGNLDCRNYGELAGIPSARAYWADVLGCKPEQTFIGGPSSLTLMSDVITRAYTHGLLHSEQPWCKEAQVKFLCPSPGYDRHFRITEFMGAELIPIPMTYDGPDMDLVEKYVQDKSVKGIWCVPKYSNPDGIVYSDETVRRFANLNPAAPDFVIMWDNAYGLHEFEGDYRPFPDILSLCAQAGHPDMVMEFASTSKITFAGAGFSVLAASEANIAYFTKLMGVQMISYDKVNQLRHVRFFGDIHGMVEHMRKHADILRPKFELVHNALETELGGLGIGTWTNPKGGYFVSFDSLDGCAKEIVSRCKKAGLVLTGAGATYPYGKDPHDSNIRIAPSFPNCDDLAMAMKVFTCVVKLVSVKKYLADMDAAEQHA